MINTRDLSCEAAVVGTGLGGSSFAYGLSRRGFRTIVVDEGESIQVESADRAPIHYSAFGDKPYVGGLSKFFGASMYRLREIDFAPTEMEAGVSPGWPISYLDLEPFYAEAERLYKVHGSSENDPTEPPRSGPWPYAPIPHQGPVRELVERLTTRAKVPVSYIPRSIDYDPGGGGSCVLCRHCDAYFCPREAKIDSELGALRPAIKSGDVTLMPRTTCLRIITSADGRRVEGIRVKREGEEFTIHARIVAVSGGVMGTPLLLWRSRNDHHPNGLGNRSGNLGRNFGAHTMGWVFPIKLGVQRTPFHQKTFAIHAFYESAPGWPYPTGTIQSAGYIEPIGVSRRYLPFVATLLKNSFQTFIMSEGLPTSETGFHLSDNGVNLLRAPIQNVK
ncbi:MAG TPA: GMC family oxidoreductase, partial [Gemmatimonadaceae bacterium]|nr:GMC family oxidoreductase [Gemmatimonadaceae bacterium]